MTVDPVPREVAEPDRGNACARGGLEGEGGDVREDEPRTGLAKELLLRGDPLRPGRLEDAAALSGGSLVDRERILLDQPDVGRDRPDGDLTLDGLANQLFGQVPNEGDGERVGARPDGPQHLAEPRHVAVAVGCGVGDEHRGHCGMMVRLEPALTDAPRTAVVFAITGFG